MTKKTLDSPGHLRAALVDAQAFIQDVLPGDEEDIETMALIERLSGRISAALAQHPQSAMPSATPDNEELRIALDELVKLQRHYAELLNMHDGGKRMGFTSADAWIARLRETGTLPKSTGPAEPGSARK